MPLLGAHMSIAGGLHLAFRRIRQVGGEALQIFTKNQVQWHAEPIDPEGAILFRKAWEEAGRMPVAAHDSYLINLASGDKSTACKSIAAFAEELRRCETLGIPYLVAHPGSHLGEGVRQGLERFTTNLDSAMETAAAENVTVLIETTAGQGTNLGSRFEEIACILQRSRYGNRLGVCFDTCHAFAAGYDLRDPQRYGETFARFQAVIGTERIHLFHVNDCKGGLGSKVDRHEHIGKGQIGLDGFRILLNDPRFKAHPMVLETPKGKDLKNDRRNLRVLRSLMAHAEGRGKVRTLAGDPEKSTSSRLKGVRREK
ncbi:MAG: deoxyribonuclease IV [Deltaproteobacteria bacterium]|nr:deoxyribonuclease IV [Deltaproteobacteria bacterium]